MKSRVPSLVHAGARHRPELAVTSPVHYLPFQAESAAIKSQLRRVKMARSACTSCSWVTAAACQFRRVKWNGVPDKLML